MSDWGQGSKNNDIGWGQGANNEIGWGAIHALSYSGDTDIVGSVSPVTQLLLDEYPNAAAAYSLRELSTAFVGQPVVRVRRSDNNAEQDFTATEITDGTLTTFTGANDGFVTTWYDQSGNAYNLNQTSAGRQLKIVNSGTLITGFNGLPCMNASIGNGFLSLPRADFAFTHQSQATFSFVYDTTPGNYLCASTDANQSTLRTGIDFTFAGFSVCNGSGTDYVIEHDFNIIGAYNLFIDYDCTEVIAGNKSNMYVNGNLRPANTATGTPSASNSFADFMLIGRRNGESNFVGKYHEIIIWDERKDTDAVSIQANINNYYNIYP